MNMLLHDREQSSVGRCGATKRTKWLWALGILAGLIIIFLGYHYIQFLRATSQMAELSVDLEKRIAEWEKKEYKRPPLFGPALEGNAAELYQQANEQMFELVGKTNTYTEWREYVDDFKPLNTASLSYYEKARPIIELVKQANRMTLYKSPFNLRDGFESKIPNFLAIRNIAYALAIQGRELANNNQYSETLQRCCGIIRFGDSYLYHSTLISAMLSIAASEIGCEEIRRLLLSGKLSDQNKTELLISLRTLFYPETPFDQVWDAVQLNEEAGLLKYAKITGFTGKAPMIIGSKKSFISWFKYYIWFNRTDYIEAAKDIKTIYPEIKRINQLPYAQAQKETEQFELTLKILSNPLSQAMIPNILSGKTYYFEHLAQRRGLYILCGLEIYKAKHQKYPDKLADLAPEIIPDIPLDPFPEQPFIYKLQPDGSVMLYSIGSNLKDDNGDAFRYNDIVIAPIKKP